MSGCAPAGFERLITFADAVVAIALTLLVLPLVEIPAELGADSSLADVFTEHRGQIGGFCSASSSSGCSGPLAAARAGAGRPAEALWLRRRRRRR